MPHSEYLIHKKKRHTTKKKNISSFDKVVLFVSVAYPMSALPQAIDVLRGDSAGVSLLSWFSFLICAVLFFIYGLKNNVVPMIISNFLWIVMDGLVVIGLLAYKMI